MDSEEAQGRYWDDNLAQRWMVIQKMYNMDLVDGVVERHCLKRVVVDPKLFLGVRQRVEDELEKENVRGDVRPSHLEWHGKHRTASSFYSTGHEELLKKPSYEDLCKKLGTTMARVRWLHRLFESYLEGADEAPPGQAPRCGYPDNPATLTKVRMQQLMQDVRPDMDNVEFEMRFKRIDADGSGTVEFDEFVFWLAQDEVAITPANVAEKPNIKDLAEFFEVPEDIVQDLHQQFQDCLPEPDAFGMRSEFLSKSQARALIADIMPDVSDGEFEAQFQHVFESSDAEVDFQKFLGLVDFDMLLGEEGEA